MDRTYKAQPQSLSKEFLLSKPRVAYVSLRYTWASGVFHKLCSQANGCKKAGIPIDFYWIGSDPALADRASDSALTCIHLPARGFLATRAKQLKIMKEILREYDVAVVRYPLFDPILWLGLTAKDKVVWEHHTLELPELRGTSKVRFLVELLFGKLLLWKAAGYTAVTQEIVDDLKKRYPPGVPGLMVTNSLDFDAINILNAGPIADGADPPVNIIFVAGIVFPWHGLDQIVAEFAQVGPDIAVLHIVGKVDPHFRSQVEQTTSSVRFYGQLFEQELYRLYAKCSLGIGSFGFDTLNMKEGATLKVREYLAFGLPVYTGCPDSGFSSEFPYLIHSSAFRLTRAVQFVKQISSVSRQQVREAASKCVGTAVVSEKLYDFAIQCAQRASEP